MNAAVISLAVVVTAVMFSAVGLFAVNESAAGWTTLGVGLFSVVMLLGTVITSARTE